MRGLTRKSPHGADYRRAMTSTYKRARKLALQIIHRLRVVTKQPLGEPQRDRLI